MEIPNLYNCIDSIVTVFCTDSKLVLGSQTDKPEFTYVHTTPFTVCSKLH
jgi:hypothetical protein